ncbi:MAG: LysR family transcriptional regulator [Lachnospiraceae bacterium]|nr:LysR family transcriptional regulator [Lachnospiraceae bacterium]MBQ6195888.1 LysR family transcriptional regulator [Lachnospiraceae bacterium]
MFSNPEYVYEVYKERSFSRAAKNLFISQPALSVTIKRIEKKIGAPIFDRSTNPIGLTECGEKYIEVIKQYMDLQNGFMNYLNNLEELNVGSIKVGGSSLFTACILPSVIARFNSRYPRVRIHVTEANTPQLDQLLMDGDLDLIIDNSVFDTETHDSELFRMENLLLAVPASFAVNEDLIRYQITAEDITSKQFLSDEVPAVPFEKFAGDPFILLKSGNDTRDRAMQIFAAHHIKPNVILSLDQQMTSYNVACSGIGIAFVTDTLIMNTYHNPNVVFYKLDPQFSRRALSFFHKKGKYVTHAMTEFLKTAAEIAIE